MTVAAQQAGSSAWDLTKQTYSDWSEDKAPRLAAALAFYAMLSLAPLLIICIAVVGFVVGQETVQAQATKYMASLMGQQGQQAGQQIIQSGGKALGGGSGIIATIVSAAILLFSASGVFTQLQESLDTIWEVKPKLNQGMWATVRSRLVALVMVISAAILLLALVAGNTVLTALTGMLSGGGFVGAILGSIGALLVTIGIATLLFALVFKYVPHVQIEWRVVWPGAILTAVLFGVGNYLLSWYLGRGSATSMYGAAGSIVAVLLWVYYTSQILFFGAEFTQAWARRKGEQIRPSADAEPLTEEDRARQGTSREQPRPQPARADAAAPARRLREEPGVPAGNGRAGSHRPAPSTLVAMAGLGVLQLLRLWRARPKVQQRPSRDEWQWYRSNSIQARRGAKALLPPQQRGLVDELEQEHDHLRSQVVRTRAQHAHEKRQRWEQIRSLVGG